MAGKMVRLTPKGLSVMSRQRAISLVSSSGVGCVSAVNIPRPPALETADAISAIPTPIIPPCTTGCLIPSNSVILVLIIVSSTKQKQLHKALVDLALLLAKGQAILAECLGLGQFQQAAN